MASDSNRITTRSAAETRAVGAALGQVLQPGDVVLLSGDLGAGKTQFAQGVAAGLGAGEVPISPTFNIVITYDSGRLPLHHFDVYRLDSEEQLEDIGIAEYMESGGVCLVEWAEKFPAAFDASLAVQIEKVSADERVLRVRALNARGVELVGDLADRCDLAARGGGIGTVLRQSSLASLAAELRAVPMPPPRATCSGSGELARFARIAGGREGEGSLASLASGGDGRFVLGVDTANEIVAVALGRLEVGEQPAVTPVVTREVAAHRASNTTLLPLVDELLESAGVSRESIACICVGRGPGSFTGVRIAMAAAKGMAAALGVPLVGVSTLDAVAWSLQAHGVRGDVLVVADAMRKEVYPVRYVLTDADVQRCTADCVVKAQAFAEELEFQEGLQIAGDALVKYRDLFEPHGTIVSDKLWEVSGHGLLLALEAAWMAGDVDPLDACRHDPAFALPVYTRLSDAEENERVKLARTDDKNLTSGVQDVAPDGGKGRATMHSQAHLVALADEAGVAYHPLDAAHADDIAALEEASMGTDAWSARLVADELGQRNRTWWVAECEGAVVGYAGGLVVDGDLQILKVAVDSAWRRRGIAHELICRVAEDARNLGASTCSLEVRASNAGAQAFYSALGLEKIGVRPRYYSDREDAVIMRGALPRARHDVAGMRIQHLEKLSGPAAREEGLSGPAARGKGAGLESSGPAARGKGSAQKLVFPDGGEDGEKRRSLRSALPPRGGAYAAKVEARDNSGFVSPLILAIESSCDETAAAVVDGEGRLLSDVVASQIDFHARFGGVVPEIASRKHIEAICGVCAEALETAGIGWADLDAVASTYAPGLLGALVVGVAFAKGAAWALDVPFIGVNHLEGHLYANKIDAPDFAPPAVVSLVSGGNTMLVHMRDWGDYQVLGETIDDAVGEAFDKVAKALGLGYPGGPVISKAAAEGSPDAIAFPRAMLHSHDLRFSLSGLKTAVVNYINNERSAGRELNVADIAASFQQAVIDVQVAKAKTALQQTNAPVFCLGGGVAANPALRAAYEDLCASMDVRLIMPPLASCGDNAGMIALVALDRYRAGAFFPLDADAQAHADIGAPY